MGIARARPVPGLDAEARDECGSHSGRDQRAYGRVVVAAEDDVECAVARQERGGEEVGAKRAIGDQGQPGDGGRVDARGSRERMVVGDEQHVGIVEEVNSRECIVQRWVAREDDVEVTDQSEIG